MLAGLIEAKSKGRPIVTKPESEQKVTLKYTMVSILA